MEKRAWQLSLDGSSFKTPVDPRAPIHWHNGTFEGGGVGITDHGGPKELVATRLWSEVDVIHSRLVGPDPELFFATPGSLWYYTGSAGYAPDFIGIDHQNNLLIGELKWSEGWHPRLAEQFEQYTSNLVCGNPSEYGLQFFIAAPQTCSVELIKNIRSQADDLRREWRQVRVRFGFMQLGWIEDRKAAYFLRVLWFDSSEWTGTGFSCSEEAGPVCI